MRPPGRPGSPGRAGGALRERGHGGGDRPIPSRTRQLSPPSPKVLRIRSAGGRDAALAQGASAPIGGRARRGGAAGPLPRFQGAFRPPFLFMRGYTFRQLPPSSSPSGPSRARPCGLRHEELRVSFPALLECIFPVRLNASLRCRISFPEQAFASLLCSFAMRPLEGCSFAWWDIHEANTACFCYAERVF